MFSLDTKEAYTRLCSLNFMTGSISNEVSKKKKKSCFSWIIKLEWGKMQTKDGERRMEPYVRKNVSEFLTSKCLLHLTFFPVYVYILD